MSITDIDKHGVIFSFVWDKQNKIVGFSISANSNLNAQLFCSHFYAFRKTPEKRVLDFTVSGETLVLRTGLKCSCVKLTEYSFRLGINLIREFENVVRNSCRFEPFFTDEQIIMIFR